VVCVVIVFRFRVLGNGGLEVGGGVGVWNVVRF